MSPATVMKKIHVSDYRWTMIILGIWLILAAIPRVEDLLPGSWWFQVWSVHVEDTVEGADPEMVVVRTIHRPFRAEWVAEVERWHRGGFTAIPSCSSKGSSSYSPDNDLPEPLHLSWWIYPADCSLLPGRYRVETVWTLPHEQEVRAFSNVFKVHRRMDGF
jgi:hypothetical protein